MKPETLRQLLQKDEYGALDFKRKPHAVFNEDKILAEQSQHELIRDVVALANGNPHVVGETAYLVFGADDNKGADGKRRLSNVDDFSLTRRQLLDWINPKITPRITEIGCDAVSIDDKNLFVITIYSSEDVYITTTKLQTTDRKQYSPQTTFIRVDQNNEPATRQEERTLQKAKRRYFEHSSYIHPVWAIGFSMGGTAFLIYQALGHLVITDEMTATIGPDLAQVLILTVPTVVFFLMGLGIGKTVVDFRGIQRMWIQGTRRRRSWIISIIVLYLAFLFVGYWLFGVIGLR